MVSNSHVMPRSNCIFFTNQTLFLNGIIGLKIIMAPLKMIIFEFGFEKRYIFHNLIYTGFIMNDDF